MILIIIGASGHLARSKIIPALFELYKTDKTMGGIKRVIGYSRTSYTNEEYRSIIREHIGTCSLAEEFVRYHSYFCGEYDDLSMLYNNMERISDVQLRFYCAVPPIVYICILENVRKYWKSNFIIFLEKPIGVNYNESLRIEELIKKYYQENMVYRVDHYLHKEGFHTIRNVRRLAGDRKLSKICIVMHEMQRLGSRVGYFDTTGLILDVVQNHLLQLLAHILIVFGRADSVADMAKHLQILKNTIRISQYREYEEDVKKTSETETGFYGEFVYNKEKENVCVSIEAKKRADMTQTTACLHFRTREQCTVVLTPETVPISDDGEDFESYTNKIQRKDTVESGKALPTYTKLLMHIKDPKERNFVTREESMSLWEITYEIQKYISLVDMKPVLY